ncbi:MAG: DUF4270 family protein [Bacteroidales bacterium]|nr:DUF4270 family protein [Bacteroidales bacterium]
MKRLISLRQLLLVALVSLVIASCTKEITPIGSKLLDPGELLSMGYTDTVQIRAYSITDDSVYTLNLSYAQIGSMYDPIFGRTDATFYSEVITSLTSTRFGTSPVFDSAYLYLPYKTSYGDTISNMTFHVYHLAEPLLDSIHSYSNRTIAYEENNQFGSITFQPSPHDSSYYDGVKHAPTLRIPINSNFGNLVLAADTTSLNTASAFAEYFKGISIVADRQNTSGKGCIVSFDLATTSSYIKMYYHNPGDTVKVYNFYVNSSCSHFQNYDHNGYAEAIPQLSEQIAGNTSLGQQFLFAQGLGGIKIKIEFPYLKQSFEPSKMLINDAQLILGNASVSDVFTAPTYISLRGVGEKGTTSPYTIIDEDEGSGYFDGIYDEGSKSYRFRLTRYIQQLLLGQVNNNGLHLIIPSSGLNGSRLVLNGTASEQSDMKLYLRYTILK